MSQRTSWGMIILLWAAGLGAAAQYGKISIIFDRLPMLYPGAGASLGFIVSLVGFVGVIFGVVAGIFAARFGFRHTMLAALWVGALMSAFQSLVPPLGWMLLSRLIEGASHLALVVAIPTLIAQLATDGARGMALSLWSTFFAVAFALLALLGLPLVASAGPQALFAAHAVYMAIFAVVLGVFLRPLGLERPKSALSLPQIIKDHGDIYRSLDAVMPAAGWLFYTFCFVAILTVLPPYLDPADRAFVMTAMPLLSIATSLTLGVLLLRVIAAVRVVQIGFLLSTGMMVWLWFVPADIYACLALAGAMGLIQGASFAAVPELNKSARAQAGSNGAMAQMGNLGNSIGTPIMAMTAATFGYGGLPVLTGFAFAAGLALLLYIGRLRRT